MPRKKLVNGMTVSQLIAWHREHFGDARMEDPPQRPDDVTQEEWDALGDPGRRAIDRVKRAQREADRQRETAAAAQAEAAKERDEARVELENLRKNPPKAEPPKNDAPDVAAQIQQAVASALENVTKVYDERLDALKAERTAEQITARAREIATPVMVDPALVGTFVDLRTVLNPQGEVDEQALRDNLATLLEQRPYLKRPDLPPVPPGGGNPFGGHPGGARPAPDKATFDARVAEQLEMARQSGLAVRGEAKAST